MPFFSCTPTRRELQSELNKLNSLKRQVEIQRKSLSRKPNDRYRLSLLEKKKSEVANQERIVAPIKRAVEAREKQEKADRLRKFERDVAVARRQAIQDARDEAIRSNLDRLGYIRK